MKPPYSSKQVAVRASTLDQLIDALFITQMFRSEVVALAACGQVKAGVVQ